MGLLNFLFGKKKNKHHNPKKEGSSLFFISEQPWRYMHNLYNTLSDLSPLKTEREIMFGEVPFGISYEELRNLKGKPIYKEDKKFYTNTFTAVLYKNKMYGIKRIIIYYFANNKFVLGENIFTSYIKDDVMTYRKALLDKYNVQVGDDKNNFVLQNNTGASLFYDEKIEITMTYLCPFSSLPQVLTTDMRNVIMSNQKKAQEAVLYNKIYDTL